MYVDPYAGYPRAARVASADHGDLYDVFYGYERNGRFLPKGGAVRVKDKRTAQAVAKKWVTLGEVRAQKGRRATVEHPERCYTKGKRFVSFKRSNGAQVRFVAHKATACSKGTRGGQAAGSRAASPFAKLARKHNQRRFEIRRRADTYICSFFGGSGKARLLRRCTSTVSAWEAYKACAEHFGYDPLGNRTPWVYAVTDQPDVLAFEARFGLRGTVKRNKERE